MSNHVLAFNATRLSELARKRIFSSLISKTAFLYRFWPLAITGPESEYIRDLYTALLLNSRTVIKAPRIVEATLFAIYWEHADKISRAVVTLKSLLPDPCIPINPFLEPDSTSKPLSTNAFVLSGDLAVYPTIANPDKYVFQLPDRTNPL